jgi:anti-sigma regulatory factor (Ser/Thr protein kinase)
MGSGFRHEALIYGDTDEFLACAVPFVSAALAAGEPVLVAVSDRNVGLLGRELGSLAAEVRFAAVGELARNPARVIPFWRDFLEEHDGGPVRGLEEPVWPGRSEVEIDECERHESLLNLAFSAETPLSLLCAYDATLPDGVLNAVPRCHRFTVDGGATRLSGDYRPAQDNYAGRLSPPPSGAASFEFDLGGLGEVRRRVEKAAEGAGLSQSASADLVLAASELAANSVAHGGGDGTLRTWREDDRLLVDLEDAGWISEPLAGRLRPAVTQKGGRGLWLANQLCDLVQIRSGAAGTTVRLQVALD